MQKMEQRLFQGSKRPRKFDIQRRFSIHQLHGGIQQITDVIHTSPHLRHAPIHAQQSVYRLHGCPYRILGSKDRISGCLGKLAEKSEVHTAVRNHIRTVSFRTRHEKRGDIWHHGGYADRAVFGKLRNLLHRNADMIQPFLRNLHSGAVLHRLFHEISGNIRKQSIDPDADLFRILFLKLSLAIDGPA